MFSSEFCKIYKSTFSYSTPHVAASEFWRFSFNLEELRNSVSGNVGSPNFVFRFLEQKFLEFFEATESYISALSLTKYFRRLLNVFVDETVWHCIFSFPLFLLPNDGQSVWKVMVSYSLYFILADYLCQHFSNISENFCWTWYFCERELKGGNINVA